MTTDMHSIRQHLLSGDYGDVFLWGWCLQKPSGKGTASCMWRMFCYEYWIVCGPHLFLVDSCHF